LPKAHVEAPLIGSLLLAGIILKFGGYGLLLLGPSLTWPYSIYFYLSLSGSVVCAVLCLRSWDMKSMVAYSSVVHIGAVTLGVLSGSNLGFSVASGMLMCHTLVSPLLFLLAHELYLCNSSRSFLCAHSSSLPPAFFVVLVLCLGINFGLPPSLGFCVEVCLFSSLGSYISSSLIFLCLSSFFCFLYCAFFVINASSGPASPKIFCVVTLFIYLPSLFYCFVSPFCFSFFCVA